ncbi:hypothetical protein OBBRIDRAFT_813420 [Obba rivulosa]|uniref:Uncharacterized protein n=1 Tax=Obba rivulosa TaxID=1052685 RepID=A0A8E2B0F4_9APHY|nr:hypothetical protein OBBRIDRAFT_813420 [Obba rivulosa]
MATRLSRLFTVEYARRINMQIVHPAQSQVVKPNELESALPHKPPAYLAATLSYGIIKAFFLANEYLRAHHDGIPGLADREELGAAYESVNRRNAAAAGKLGVQGPAGDDSGHS